MPSKTGIWSKEEAETGHVFDYKLAQWLGQYFPKNVPVIDFGCGPGTYLRYFHDIGFEKLVGVEGSELNFEISTVVIKDLSKPLFLNEKGNVLCLEVAEHIPEQYMDTLLTTIIEHLQGTLVLSWAIPGQDGLGHVNCRHNIWVIDEMRRRGLTLQLADSLMARQMISNYAHWLRDTIMIFKR